MATRIGGSDNFDTAQVSGDVLQIVSKKISTQTAQTIVAGHDNQLGTGTDWVVNIVPKGTNSIFEIEVRWFGEAAVSYNLIFNIQRNGQRVNQDWVGSKENTDYGLSMPAITYNQSDTNSTPELTNFKTFDKSDSIIGRTIEYKVVVNSANASAVYTNRTANATVANGYEKSVSEIIITEYANNVL